MFHSVIGSFRRGASNVVLFFQEVDQAVWPGKKIGQELCK
jgi:hypothetical protein